MADVEVDDTWLRRFVVAVRTRDAQDRPLGTGVLIAPGWVLTCAHVVARLEEVDLVLDPGAGTEGADRPPARIRGAVMARSAAPGPGAATAFWPFPDLAVLELDWTGHVCAPLATVAPSGTSRPHAWGFARREDGVPSPGAAASFTYAGSDGDGYLTLTAGVAAPGLSGAPLVCPHHRGVVALMSLSRDPYAALGGAARGGWAAPVAALAGPGLPADLAQFGGQVLARNREQAWRHRDAWNRVLPVPDAPVTVDRPWAGVDAEAAGAPSMLLRAEFGVVDYAFRDAELAAARTWCQTRARLAISYVDAHGGSGKTRFGIELCKQMSDRGWVAGLLPKTGRGVDGVPLARLVVVDYVEDREMAVLAEQLAGLERSATPLTPVRILLLRRPAVGALAGQVLEPLLEQPAVSGPVLQAVETARDRSGVTAGLTGDERVALFRAAYTAFATHRNADSDSAAGASTSARPGGVDLSAPRYARPLDVLLEAFDAALSGPGWQPGSRPAVDRVLDHEARHWAARIPDLPPAARRACVGLATLAGARNQAEADALLDLVPGLDTDPAAATRRRTDEWLRSLYEGPDRWNPLRPDRLGEALIARVLRERADTAADLVGAVLDLDSDPQVERAFEVIVRLALDPAADVIARALLARYPTLVQRALRQARGTPGHPGRAGLLDALARTHLALLTDDRLATQPLPVQVQVSASADVLADLARDYGRAREAQALYDSAMAIDQRKTELEPGNTTYRRDLSISYNKLADLALAAGRSGDAEALYRQSLQVAQELTELEPGNTTYRRDLSISYERLGEIAVQVGQQAQAHQSFMVAVEARSGLHRQEPQRVDLAEELGVTLYLLTQTADDPSEARQEIVQVLAPFERAGTITPKGSSLLAWARDIQNDG